jgi:hypothetical protein
MTTSTGDTLLDQLIVQKSTLETSIQQSEVNLTKLKEQYLKVLGALEFADLQKKQSEAVANDTDTAEALAS